MATGLIERWPSGRPARHLGHWRRRRSAARLVSSVAIGSVVWFTSTSWQRDRLFAPYSHDAQLVLRAVVVDRESAVLDKSIQHAPLVVEIPERLAQGRLRQDCLHQCQPHLVHAGQYRHRLLLT